MPRQNAAARGLDVLGVGPGHPGEIDDSGRGDVKRLEPGGVRLELPQALGPDQLRSLDTVRHGPAMELFEPGKLLRGRGDDHLPATLERNPALLAEPGEPRRALDAEIRLQRSRRVVHTGVHDAA